MISLATLYRIVKFALECITIVIVMLDVVMLYSRGGIMGLAGSPHLSNSTTQMVVKQDYLVVKWAYSSCTIGWACLVVRRDSLVVQKDSFQLL